MVSADATISTNALRMVEGMLDDDVPFENIEEFIERTSVSTEVRSALWLLAYAEQERPTRVSVAETIVALGD